jgi:hypothetical protein
MMIIRGEGGHQHPIENAGGSCDLRDVNALSTQIFKSPLDRTPVEFFILGQAIIAAMVSIIALSILALASHSRRSRWASLKPHVAPMVSILQSRILSTM